MKYRVVEKIVGSSKPIYYVQKGSLVLFLIVWEDVVGFESKETAICVAKEYSKNRRIKRKIIWDEKTKNPT